MVMQHNKKYVINPYVFMLAIQFLEPKIYKIDISSPSEILVCLLLDKT